MLSVGIVVEFTTASLRYKDRKTLFSSFVPSLVTVALIKYVSKRSGLSGVSIATLKSWLNCS